MTGRVCHCARKPLAKSPPRLSIASQPRSKRKVSLRAVADNIHAAARRHGAPDPIILEAKVRPLPVGGYVLGSNQLMNPHRAEHGGDGRMPADAKAEAPAPDPKGAKVAAAKIKAQLKQRA